MLNSPSLFARHAFQIGHEHRQLLAFNDNLDRARRLTSVWIPDGFSPPSPARDVVNGTLLLVMTSATYAD